ncbi:imidazole glycerol phosphate synthase subunit HisH [Halorhodospira halochloris]|uniref:imidazole glycerol phosphate synthase subunit HisH n=1 Tax=Halorhodospira halochloris TaxID=1052 RepID=UPI001EE96D95|nr:imidazole glycerol phosphate synthase subunit HisH [Halorhodospira halochloris]MCG5530941.1 imidazole glycerol phosphate synthase subunit HisH [Halorhodospira halochloris]MCG5549160.1 imidazole glycerol phosphate synthase subunit HisH [Halorhodospira halochloris]
MSRVQLAIVDYGMGNLYSVRRAFEHAAEGRCELVVTADPQQVRDADRVVLPGVGAIGDCMVELTRLGLREAVIEAATSKPFLGICLGMQALLEHSEESGGVAGLGLVPGQVLHFPRGDLDGVGRVLKVPHMGWSRVYQANPHPLWAGIKDGSWFYFVHSYYAVSADRHAVVGEAEHGRRFAAALARGSCFAVQFHPEKSQAVGLQLYRNFVTWDGSWS